MELCTDDSTRSRLVWNYSMKFRRVNSLQEDKMKFDQSHEGPTLDSVMHIMLASVFVVITLVAAWPGLETIIV